MRLNESHRQWLPLTNLMVSTALFLFLAVGKVLITEQSTGHKSQSNFNEELNLEQKNDYDRTSVESGWLQTEHGDSSKLSSMTTNGITRKGSHELASSHNDPFALTFEDYLREASKGSAHHVASETNDDDDSSFSSSADAIPNTTSLMIEDDEEKPAKAKESLAIDYIFPPSRQETSHQHEKHETKPTNKEIGSIASNSNELFNEIRLLFSWKQLPTNKCSKICGKGFRLKHLSCVDLKYDVKVEDVLCLKANLVKPSEISEEPCNEIDCLPQWTSIEFQECNSVSGEPCSSKLYKRAQCTMLDKTGALVYLDDSRCTFTGSPAAQFNHHTNETHLDRPNLSTFESPVFEDEVNADDTTGVDERNDIVPNLAVDGALESLLSRAASNQAPQYEPFFEPGPWSQCSGAPCGQLGLRRRNLSCRLHLSRSSKFVELPESSCQNAPTPEVQEPCYMDCGPETNTYSGSSNIMFNGSDVNDETVYDLEMTRFIWKKGGWTKCSADCLGGKRESIVECWDNESRIAVEQDHCEADNKPHTITEVCNDIPCNPEWKVGDFSKCTRLCGSAGIRSRNVECIQQVPSQGEPSFLVVSNDLCIQTYGLMPNKSEPCNRVDCKPEWSVGPWSECGKRCGDGIRNRTVICVQEFANKDGPMSGPDQRDAARPPSPDLLDALSISAKNWTPGQVTQVPFHECYEEYKSIPSMDERCFTYCDPYIDADVYQEYHMTRFNPSRKKSITLRIGGKAEIIEGQNLRIRCKIVNGKTRDNLVKKQSSQQVEWRKDGVQIFLNGSKVADKQYVPEDNSIYSSDVFADEKNLFMADEPSLKKTARVNLKRSNSRNLVVRSWDNNHGSHLEPASQEKFSFIPQRGGRFSSKENTLRIKKLKLDDSGTYTCSHGSLRESLELRVVNRRIPDDGEQKSLNNLSL